MSWGGLLHTHLLPLDHPSTAKYLTSCCRRNCVGGELFLIHLHIYCLDSYITLIIMSKEGNIMRIVDLREPLKERRALCQTPTWKFLTPS